MSDDEYDTRVGRHTVEEEIKAGGMPTAELGGHLRAEVTIEASGSKTDRPDTYRLVEAIEEAVLETVDDFETSDDEGGDA